MSELFVVFRLKCLHSNSECTQCKKQLISVTQGRQVTCHPELQLYACWLIGNWVCDHYSNRHKQPYDWLTLLSVVTLKRTYMDLSFASLASVRTGPTVHATSCILAIQAFFPKWCNLYRWFPYIMEFWAIPVIAFMCLFVIDKLSVTAGSMNDIDPKERAVFPLYCMFVNICGMPQPKWLKLSFKEVTAVSNSLWALIHTGSVLHEQFD